MYNEDGDYVGARYTVSYEGYLFDGDTEGINFHDIDSWEEVYSLMVAYRDIITVKHNEYDITWEKGEWF